MPRTIRSVEERVAALDEKINKKKTEIAKLEQLKQNLLTPKPRKKPLSIKQVLDQAKAEGMKPDEIAKRLGIKVEN